MKSFLICVLAILGCVGVIAYRPGSSASDLEADAAVAAPEQSLAEQSSPADQVNSPATQQAEEAELAFLSGLQSESDACRRSEAIQRAADGISDARVRTVLNQLLASSSPAAAEMAQLLTRRWAEQNPLAAASWAEHLNGRPFQTEALRQVAIAWAEKDLPAAVDWARAMPEGVVQQAVALGIGYEASRKEPVSALELAGTLPQTSERDELLVHAVSQWANSDWESAAQWALTVREPGLREQMLSAIAVAAAEQNGAAAATLVAGSLSEGPAQARAAVAVAQRWTQQSPQDAAGWIAQFPQGAIRDSALQNVITVWAEQDIQAAGAWLYKQGERRPERETQPF